MDYDDVYFIDSDKKTKYRLSYWQLFSYAILFFGSLFSVIYYPSFITAIWFALIAASTLFYIHADYDKDEKTANTNWPLVRKVLYVCLAVISSILILFVFGFYQMATWMLLVSILPRLWKVR